MSLPPPAGAPPLAVHFVSLGCPKNRIDTEVMLGHVASAGHRIVGAPEEADVIVVNTCGFVTEAKQESIAAILELARYKEAGTCRRLVVAGCLAQRYPTELAREMPEVDVFLGTDEVGLIADAVGGRTERVRVVEQPRYLYDHLSPRRPSMARHTAYVKIAEGCDRRCSFCVIPALRGPQRSRAPDSVVREVEALAAMGAREICLVAQDLTSYGSDLSGAGRSQTRPLERLLEQLAAVEDMRWIRLLYTYPTAITGELLKVMAGETRIAKYLDVPLQHVDDGVLKLMRRGHGGRLARAVVERVRARVPGATLRTTFIVGHPGESEAAFLRLCDFVREAEIDRVGVFPFSPEEGTVAALLPGRVAAREVEARRRELLRIQREISKRKLRAMRGRQIEVLVEGPSDSEYLFAGRHEGQAPEIDGQVYLSFPPEAADRPPPAPGALVQARVTHSAEYDLVACIVP